MTEFLYFARQVYIYLTVSGCFIFFLGTQSVTFNGSVTSANFTFDSNVNVSLDMSLRLRTRKPSTVVIEVHADSSRFFKMELTNGQVKISFALEGESGFILSGRIIGRF